MARFDIFLLIAVYAMAAHAQTQRNRPFPTTKRPEPTTQASPTSSTTQQSSPYAAAGFRPGRAFDLPTETKNVPEPTPSYGPPARDGRANNPAPPATPTPSYGPPARDGRANNPTPPATPTSSYGPPSRDARTQTPAPVQPYPGYGPPTARDGRNYTPPPTADPLPTYLPPVDKYGPPSTPAEPEPTTQRSPTPRNLGNGFYFIQLPNGFISRTGLLSVAVPETNNSASGNENAEDVETIEPVTTAPVSQSVPTGRGVQIQPVLQTQQRSVQFWPPRQAEKYVAAVQPEFVVSDGQYFQPVVQPEAVVPAAAGAVEEPLYYIQPQLYSYTSDFRSW